jgi:putative methyltransferase
MLVFPPSTDLHDNELLLSGKIILQDKASALSGAALEPPAEDSTFCLDGCSAPGQKTSQLAQSMENKVFSVNFSVDSAEEVTFFSLFLFRRERF